MAFLLSLAAVAAVGALVTASAPDPRVGQALGMLAFFPLMFTSGVYFPVQAMGPALRAVVELTPLGAGVQALDDANGGVFPDIADLAVVGGWAVVLGVLAVATERRR